MSVCLALLMLLSMLSVSGSVFAAPGDGTDLVKFLKSVTFVDTATNATIDISNGDKLYDGREYEITITFKETPDLQFSNGGVLSYTLPNNMRLTANITDEPLMLGDIHIGTYSGTMATAPADEIITYTIVKCPEGKGVSEDHTGHTPETCFFQDTATEIELKLKAKFDVAITDTPVQIDIGHLQYQINLPDSKISLDKAATAISSTTPRKITYTVKIKAEGNPKNTTPITDIVWTDTPSFYKTGTTAGAKINLGQSLDYTN